jgi:hypothetical protein
MVQHDEPPGPIELDSLTVRAISVEADADERSVRKRLRGEHVRGRAGERIEAVLIRRGLLVRRAA